MKRLIQDGKQKMADKSNATEIKHAFNLYLRIRPQQNGSTQLSSCFVPKGNKTFHVIVPNDSVVANFKMD